MKSNHLLVAALGLLFCLPAVAQEEQEVKGRSLRVACVTVAPESPESLWMAFKKKSTVNLVEIPLSTRSPGQPVKLSPGNTRVILGQKTGNEETPIEAQAIVNVPAEVRRGIALLIPNGKKQGLRYHAHVIDEADYKYGDVYLLNLTTNPFQVRIAGRKINLTKGKSYIYKPSNREKAVNAPVQIYCKFSNTGTTIEKWRLVTASTWRLRPTRKEFCVFYWNTQMGRPAIKALTAFPPVQR